MPDLVDRLREIAKSWEPWGSEDNPRDALTEAANEIERLRAEIKEYQNELAIHTA